MELSSPHLCGIHQNLISPVSFGNLYSLVGPLSLCRVWTSRIDVKYCFFNDLMVIVFFYLSKWANAVILINRSWATIFSSITRYDSSFSTLSFICHKLGQLVFNKNLLAEKGVHFEAKAKEIIYSGPQSIPREFQWNFIQSIF